MKTVIIGGGGTVGSAAAFSLGRRGICDEIVLMDSKEKMAVSHAMDMEIALTGISKTSVKAGGWKEAEDAAIIIVAAGVPERQVASRDEFLNGNLLIIKDIAEFIRNECPSAIVITATNPVDILNYEMYKYLNGDPKKIIGFSQNDTTRFNWAIAKVTGTDASSVSALVIGEHGEKQVRLLDTIRINDKAVTLTAEEQRQVIALTENWFTDYQKLDSGRSSGWTSGEGLANLVEALISATNQVFVCSAVLQGEYGCHNLSIGVPVRLGQNGIREIIQLPLSSHDSQKFKEAADKIRKML